MKKKASIAQEAIVGGLSGLALVVVYIIARSYAEGAEAGDWLQFAGAMLGTGLAVSGAVWIESWKRHNAEKQAKATLMDVLKELETNFADVASPLEGNAFKDVGEINARRFFLQATKNYAEFVLREHLQPDSKVWRNTSGLINYIDRILEVTWYEHDAVNGENGCTDETVAHWHKSVSKIAHSAFSIVDMVIAEQLGKAPTHPTSITSKMNAKMRQRNQ